MAYRAVFLLSGCGMYDGSDPHETVLGWLAAERHGFEPVCVAPTGHSLHVMNHTTGQVTGEGGYDLMEMSARLVKGRLLEIAEVPPAYADALFIPGGQGVIKNLLGGLGGEAHAGALALVRGVAELGRPVLAVSLAELLVNRAVGTPFRRGCFDFPPDAVHEEEGRNLFLTPGFTAAQTVSQAAAGIDLLFKLARERIESSGRVLAVR